jgi:UDP-N-acetyl-D-mannosaminuronic acid transferase (WecB/TagA/CpsF family)
VKILSVPIATVNMNEAVARIEEWVRNGARTFVTVNGIRGVMESRDDEEVRLMHNAAGMCVPDTVPTIWVGLSGLFCFSIVISGMAGVHSPLLRILHRGLYLFRERFYDHE